jgi:hypothetical protein
MEHSTDAMIYFCNNRRLPIYPEFIGEEFLSANVLERVKGFVDDYGYISPTNSSGPKEEKNGRA